MKNYTVILGVLLFSALISELNASTMYARANGDWNQGSNWSTEGVGGASCECVPQSTDDVIIDGYTMHIGVNSETVTVNSLTLQSSSRSAKGQLNVRNGNTLVVSSDLTLFGNRSGGDQVLSLKDDMSLVLIGNDLIIDHNLGDDIIIDLKNNSQIDIVHDVVINKLGGDDIRFQLNQNKLNSASFNVGNNFIVTGSNVYDAMVEIMLNGINSKFSVAGNLTGNFRSGNAESSFEIDLNAGTMLVAGNATLNRGGEFGDCRIDLDGGDFVAGSMNVNSSGPHHKHNGMHFSIDKDSEMNITNDFDVEMTGGGKFRVHMNTLKGRDARLAVGGNMNINRSGGDDIAIVIDDNNTKLFVSGDFNVNSSGGEDLSFTLDHNATFEVDGDFNITSSDEHNGSLTMEGEDDNPTLNIGGNMVIDYNTGTGDFTFNLDGGMFYVANDFTFSNGDNSSQVDGITTFPSPFPSELETTAKNANKTMWEVKLFDNFGAAVAKFGSIIDISKAKFPGGVDSLTGRNADGKELQVSKLAKQ